tara:strand:+ start:48 stop:617 length:570 start_codon:yes stop_codon:yes gene_type:complete
MFKVIGGDYGTPPASFTWLWGSFIIQPSNECNLEKFNNEQSGQDVIDIKTHIDKIVILKEEDFGKDKKGAALLAIGGAVLFGPLGLAGGFLGGNKKEIILFIETAVGNKFLAMADEKSYGKLVKQTNNAAVKSREDIALEEFTTINKNKSEESEQSDFISELERLGALKEKGLLTEEEFFSAKAKLLNS